MASKTINTILNLQDRMSPKLVRASAKVNTMDKNAQRAAMRLANTANGMAKKWSTGIDRMIGKTAQFVKFHSGMAVSMAAMAAGAGAIQLTKQSDAYAGIQARLKLINDGQQSVAAFNEKIFQSADRVRGNYTDMASIVGKLGITASSAFKSNDEILKFSELLAKNFKISGASTEEQSSAMYQLTQAMGSGRLMGDEFRSVIENAPLLAKTIAEEMGVSMGKLKEMSSEGKITADIIKSALFNSADEIDKKFKEMPVTFSETANRIKNHINNKLQPTYQKMSAWLNGKDGQKLVDSISDGISRLALKIPSLVQGFKDTYGHVKNIYDFIKKYQDVFLIIGTFVGTAYALGKAFLFVKEAIAAAQLAGLLFNGTLLVTPIGWIVIAVSALVAGIVLLIKYWDKLKRSLKNTSEKMTVTDSRGNRKPITRNALGTRYWRGGITSMNERGGEIVDLPNGSKIIPADKSAKILNKNSSQNVFHININGVGKSTREIIDEFVPQLKLALENM
jgi:tape measure domain-containing protein